MFSGRTQNDNSNSSAHSQILNLILPAGPTLQINELWNSQNTSPFWGRSVERNPRGTDTVLAGPWRHGTELAHAWGLSPACPPVWHMSVFHLGSPHITQAVLTEDFVFLASYCVILLSLLLFSSHEHLQWPPLRVETFSCIYYTERESHDPPL